MELVNLISAAAFLAFLKLVKHLLLMHFHVVLSFPLLKDVDLRYDNHATLIIKTTFGFLLFFRKLQTEHAVSMEIKHP